MSLRNCFNFLKKQRIRLAEVAARHRFGRRPARRHKSPGQRDAIKAPREATRRWIAEMKQQATHNICPEWDPIRQVCAPLNYDRLQSPAGYIESELTVGEPEFVVVCDDERSR